MRHDRSAGCLSARLLIRRCIAWDAPARAVAARWSGSATGAAILMATGAVMTLRRKRQMAC